MTRRQISDRWDMVGKLAFVVAMCSCAEMLIFVIQGLIGLAIGGFGSTGVVGVAWRSLAWLPVVIFAAAVVLSIPLPRWPGRETRWSGNGKVRMPPMGRGMLLLFGWILFLGTALHVLSLRGQDEPMDDASGYVIVAWAGAVALLLLRIVLGTLRLLPRSWRVLPPDDGPPVADTRPDVVIPDQRFAPKDG